MNDLPKTKRHRSPGGGTVTATTATPAKARKNCDLFIKLGYQATGRRRRGAEERDGMGFPKAGRANDFRNAFKQRLSQITQKDLQL